MLLLGLFACALHAVHTGLLAVDGNRAVSTSYNGQKLPLILEGENLLILGLNGCVVEVEGVRTPAGLVVSDWSVKDAGDGTGGFVGELRAYGNRLLIEDRNTGSILALDEVATLQLRPYAGRPVLVVGAVVGAGVISVVAWRLLDREPDEAPSSPGE